MPNNRDHEMLTVAELAEWLRVGNKWVYEHADLLGAYRLGRYLRFDLSRVLEQLRAGGIDTHVGIAAQGPQREPMNSEGWTGRGTTKEQK